MGESSFHEEFEILSAVKIKGWWRIKRQGWRTWCHSCWTQTPLLPLSLGALVLLFTAKAEGIFTASTSLISLPLPFLAARPCLSSFRCRTGPPRQWGQGSEGILACCCFQIGWSNGWLLKTCQGCRLTFDPSPPQRSRQKATGQSPESDLWPPQQHGSKGQR